MWTSGQAGTINRLNGVETSWSPTWKGASGNPAIGNGTITASYIEVGRVVFYKIALTMGSTTTFGSGVWSFTLPHTPTTFLGGTVAISDTGTATHVGTVIVFDADEISIWAENQSDAVKSTIPHTWASTDTMVITGMYIE